MSLPNEAAAPRSAVEIVAVTKVFGSGDDAVRALDAVSLSIFENEFFTLLGPSGCGKTTLLRMIAGFEHPTAGSIELHGEEISSQPPYRRPVNTVFQNYALFPHLTVAENISFGLEMLRKPKAEIDATVDEMLTLVRMQSMKDRRTDQISGGQQQRVALARALAPRPQVLLLDEPLSALDLKLRKEMQGELKRLQHETGITFIFVTHDQEEALTMSDRVAVMHDGRVLQVGAPREIYDNPASRYVANFIGEMNFVDARLGRGDDGAPLLELAGGLRVAAATPTRAIADGAVTLAVRPEFVRITADGEPGSLPGRVTDAVYFGTDTLYHLELDNGDRFVSRQQNRHGPEDAFAVGSRIGVGWDRAAARILAE